MEMSQPSHETEGARMRGIQRAPLGLMKGGVGGGLVEAR